jgi:trans-aconitate 2-methyltransferase
MSDWDAAKYHRISDPQLAWGRTVASRLSPVAGERILDLGCGTGRLTEEIARRPGIEVIGLDRSAAMLREAVSRRALTPPPTPGALTPLPRRGGQTPAGVVPAPVSYVRGDGEALPFVDVFDAVFSAATFHWIPDHDRLFASIFQALKRRGRLVAQAGGAGNLDRLYGRAQRLMESAEYAHFYDSWSPPNHFENVRETEARLERAGFNAIQVMLVPAPVPFVSPGTYSEFVAAVCLRHHLDRLPFECRTPFMNRITEAARADDPPLTLDYWRLNITARKGGA